ncbi:MULTISPECIES: ACP S-malonyltransferase [unclassified Mycobacterium]|uniref:ACP S-malonyltransferase n=1 Tax=unclassified Mycobacterium TaxID=2642494 RepID=UPI0029C7E4A6|nr:MULTISPECIES: acyltransferase domain-containing protein [unclassified Mycobacterium]
MITAFVFPGQGAQHPGMLGALPDSVSTRSVLEEAVGVLGSIDALDTVASLTSTTNAQLALLICGVAAARTLTDDYGLHVDVVAGHSVGAFAAAVTAGVLTLPEAVDAVRVRGEYMARACPPGRWGMAAVTGLSNRAVADLVATVAKDDSELWIANVNAADQLVLGGTVAALELARDAAREAGARRFELLDVAVASHGPVQRACETAVRERLSGIPLRAQRADYLTNVGARRIRDDAGAVLADLSAAVTKPVRWYDIARLMPELGVDRAIELPPGHVLSRLITATDRDVEVHALADEGFNRFAARSGH